MSRVRQSPQEKKPVERLRGSERIDAALTVGTRSARAGGGLDSPSLPGPETDARLGLN